MGCCNSCETGQGCDSTRVTTPEGTVVELARMLPDPSPVIEAPPAPGEPESAPGALRSGGVKVVASRLGLAHDVANASEPIDLGACNSGSVDVVIFKLTSINQVEVLLEGALEPENYVRVSSTVLTSEGAVRFRFQRLTWKFVRLYYVASGSAGGTGVLAATIQGTRN